MEGAFGSTNVIAIMVPVGDYEREGMLARDLEAMAEVESVTALSNVEAMDGYVLTDRLTPRQFAELTDLDIEAARLLYSAYAVDQGSYGQIVGGLDRYGVPLIDMFLFVYDRMEDGYVTLDDDMTADIEDLHQQLSDAQLQLKGENFSRLVVQLALPEETPETFAFLDVLHAAAAKYYPEDVYVVGNTTSDNVCCKRCISSTSNTTYSQLICGKMK